MYEITKLNILSVAKITAFVVTTVYLVGAIVLVIILFITDSYTARHFFDSDFDDFTYLSILGIGVIIGVAGFGAGAATAAVYNQISKPMGGIKMDIELREDEDK